jgi:hypothetical protein
MTSISLHGDYRTPDEDFPRPRFGHPKDRRPDLKQIQADVATEDGRPTLAWSVDQAAIDDQAATDGWYALLTNLPETASPEQILIRYKNQPTASERRYHDLKGPLAVAPMFLHTDRRITALIGVVCLAMLIFCLIEREARRNLALATKVDALYAGRPAQPAASLIFTTLATLRLRHANDGTPEVPGRHHCRKRVLDLLKDRSSDRRRPTASHVRITGLARRRQDRQERPQGRLPANDHEDTQNRSAAKPTPTPRKQCASPATTTPTRRFPATTTPTRVGCHPESSDSGHFRIPARRVAIRGGRRRMSAHESRRCAPSVSAPHWFTTPVVCVSAVPLPVPQVSVEVNAHQRYGAPTSW